MLRRSLRAPLALIFASLLSLLMFFSQTVPTQAACPTFPYTVPAGNTSELINAINCANSNGSGSNDVINLTNSAYTLTAVYADSTGLPSVNGANIAGTLTINGNGATITRSAAGGTPDFRFFDTAPGANLTLNNLSLTNGRVATLPGGAINNLGILTLTDTTLSGNTSFYGGGLYNDQFAVATLLRTTVYANIASDYGGGIANEDGDMHIINSTIAGNLATGTDGYAGGGGLAVDGPLADIIVTNSTIAGNTAAAPNATRSGLWMTLGRVTLRNTILALNNGANNCHFSGGGNFTDAGNNIDNGTTCAFTGTVGQNTDPRLRPLANNGGLTQTMALKISSPAINGGSNAKALDQNGSALTTDQRSAGFARIVGSTVDIGAYEFVCYTFPHTVPAGDTSDLLHAMECANRLAPGTNDVINLAPASTYNLTRVEDEMLLTGLASVTSSANSGTLTINGNGATLHRPNGSPEFRFFVVDPGAVFNLNRITLSNGRVASSPGGAIYTQGAMTITDSTIQGNTALAGGAILNNGTTVIRNSLIYANIALDYGGGIASQGGTLKVINSTIFSNNALGNTATGGGGAIDTYGFSEVTITNSTIAGNSATDTPRSGLWVEGGSVIVRNSILAYNNGQINCYLTGGSLTDGGNNIDNGTFCAFGGAVGQNTDPKLWVLQDNGGPTLTLQLLSNSPAINAGSNANALDQNGAPLTGDQRGYPRIVGGTVDIGAFEVVELTSLNVQLTLQGRSNPAPHPSRVVTTHVRIMPSGGGMPFYVQDFITNQNSAFTIPNLPVGTYLFSFKGTHTLARHVTITLTTGANNHTTAVLLEGDANDNNGVTLPDFSILATAFGKALGETGYDARADFNGDNLITITDFSLLATNFGQIGDGGITP